MGCIVVIFAIFAIIISIIETIFSGIWYVLIHYGWILAIIFLLLIYKNNR